MNEKQMDFIRENWKKRNEKELFAELSKIGPEMDQKAFGEYMKTMAVKTENEVFSQKVSDTELSETSGGLCGLNGYGPCKKPQYDYDSVHCVDMFKRDIYDGGFPNCAATVEDGSWCKTNDACYSAAVDYQGMNDCAKAWQ